MSEIIYVTKENVRQILTNMWKRKKISNMDLQGLGKNLGTVIKELGLDSDSFMKAYAFRNLLKYKIRTYSDICTITDIGKKHLEQGIDEDGIEFNEPLCDSDKYYKQIELATKEKDFVNIIIKMLETDNTVYFSLGGEKKDTLEKENNFQYYLLYLQE